MLAWERGDTATALEHRQGTIYGDGRDFKEKEETTEDTSHRPRDLQESQVGTAQTSSSLRYFLSL